MISEQAGETPAEMITLAGRPEAPEMMFFAASKEYASRNDRSEKQVVTSLQLTLAQRKK